MNLPFSLRAPTSDAHPHRAAGLRLVRHDAGVALHEPLKMSLFLLATCTLLGACGGSDGDFADEYVVAASPAPARATANNGRQSASPGKAFPAAGETSAVDVRHASHWNDPETWGGVLPVAGAEVVIPAGKTVVLDGDTPALAGLRIEGTLRVDSGQVNLTAGYIDVTGAFLIGSAGRPFTGSATITLNGPKVEINDGVSRGLMVRGGRLELYGLAPQPVWTKINENAAAGSTSLTLKETTDWKAGDLVSVAPTDYYGYSTTERRRLASARGTEIELASGLAEARWGKLQYMTPNGLSLVRDASYTPPVAPAPTVLDERAAVGNLSRNIVIQGADDNAWHKDGFGAHVMIMDLKSKVVIDGVELRRVGQSGVTGRYPIHWHLLSYWSDGTLLGDAVGHELRNSAIWNSANRCVVIHGTNGVAVRNNICQDVKGHSFFLEDAVERRNVFEGNLALTNRSAPAGKILQKHEAQPHLAGPSGFWITNPDNVIRNNHAGDAQGNGFWLAFPKKPLGVSTKVALSPYKMAHGVFENNTAHTSRGPGVLLDMVPIDAAGTVDVNFYEPPSNGQHAGFNFGLKGITAYKNGEGAYRNRGLKPIYQEWVTADNVGAHFAGSVTQGMLERSLLIGTSLNNATPYPRADMPPAGLATYNSSMVMRDNTMVNFPFVEGKSSGAFMTDDYYIEAVQKGTVRSPNNRLINSHPGYRSQPPHLSAAYHEASRLHWSLSGALWDPYGYWGPKGSWSVYDVPFLTAGANCVWQEPAGKNGKSCDGQFYGVGDFQTDFDNSRYLFKAAIDAVRQDASGNEIGRWMLYSGVNSVKLGHMRHFAARTGSRYVLTFPGKPAPKWFAMTVSNAFRSEDNFLMAVAFDGSLNATGYTVAGFTHKRDDPKTWKGSEPWAKYARFFTPANNLAEVVASSGNRMWQDRASNLVWFKFQGGLPYPDEQKMTAGSNADIYRDYNVVLYARP